MEQIIKIVLAYSLLFAGAQPSIARSDECAKPVQPIEQGVEAPCSGYLFSPLAESDAWTAKQLAEALKKKSDLQTEENAILEKRLKLYMDSTQSLSQDLVKRDSTESLYRMLYFGMGVLVTSFIAINVRP